MELVYNDKTKMWEERKEPFAVVEIETEEDFNMLQKAVKQYKKQEDSGWISVDDRLPKEKKKKNPIWNFGLKRKSELPAKENEVMLRKMNGIMAWTATKVR